MHLANPAVGGRSPSEMEFDMDAVLEELEALVKDGVVSSYAVGGAVAANIYVESATTEDVDVFIVLQGATGLIVDPSPVFDYLKGKGYTVESGGYVHIGGWPVQFLSPPPGLETEAFEQAETLDDGLGAPLRVFTAEHLAAIALKTGRAKDHARLIQFWESDHLDNNRFASILSRHDLEGKWAEFRAKFEI